jgi:hypothetical protein
LRGNYAPSTAPAPAHSVGRINPHAIRWRADLLSLAGQGVLLALLLLLYNAGRRLANGHIPEAFSNARQLWAWERFWRLPNELRLERWLLTHPALARTANFYYAHVHFPLTLAALVWLFLYRRELYRWTRDVLVVLTGAGLIVIFELPMAPPRMMTGLGFTDVAAAFGQSVYQGNSTANQYASMPSLHVGWAVLVAVALIRAGRGRGRWLWLAHPAATVFVVVATANHYWADVAAGAALLAIAVLARWALDRWPKRASIRYDHNAAGSRGPRLRRGPVDPDRSGSRRARRRRAERSTDTALPVR